MTNLPQGWEVKKLGDIAEIQIGKTPSRNNIDFFQGENIWLSIRDLKSKFVSFSSEKISNEAISKTNMKIVPKGTLLMSFKLTLGKTAFADCDLYTNEAIAAIFTKDKNINKYFLDYALNFTDLEKYVDNAVKGKTLNKQKLKQIEISVPPLKEQERIVGILDESFTNIDESIKILEQDLLNLDELMQSALQKAFNPLKDDTKENYKLPQGWEWKSLGEIASAIQSGFAINKSNEIPSGYIHLRTHNITTDGSLNFDTLVKVKKELIKEQQSFIEEGDILFNNTNSTELVGKTALVTQNYNYAFSNHITKIKLFNQYSSKLVVFHFVLLLKNKYFERICHKWIGQSGINTDKLKQIQIPMPPLEEQKQIASHLDELSLNIKNLKQNYQTQIKDLQELKQSLLDKAFKGKL
ncbi:restriction endonuclease subunit S [Campylobacter sp. TTU-622]|uniref:restriction endonuclease subunit S n=1 Tax=Campylobacter sp. TTU-622 TaxID=2800583 RepID=UPI001907B61A|nr:restriction endonuclease subunit S [Campylobacter sp. TTU-622]MBK1973062.1 restriction endonuclease subunit S [Campylobacter sp. TTU-622]